MPHVDIPQGLCLAGVARSDITPPIGMYHRMWGAATHDRSTGVHRPLTATVFALRPAVPGGGGDGGGGGESDGRDAGAAPGGGRSDAILLVALDHCIIADADLADIRTRAAAAASVSAGRIHVTLSHTHGAGLLMRDRADLPGGDLIAPYLADLARRVADLAADAMKRLRLVAVTYATGRCGLAAERDFYDEAAGRFVCGFNPAAAGTADDTVLVARLEDRGSGAAPGAILATIVNYACHPTTLAWQNTLVSPDFVGALRETVERATGGDAPCLFLQGASGELAPREQYTGDVDVADRHGRALGYAALAALESLPPAAGGLRFAYRGPVVSGAVLGAWEYEPVDLEGRRALAWRYRSWTIPLPYRTDLPTRDQTRAEREQLAADERVANARGAAGAARDLHARVEQMTRQIMRLEVLPPGDAYPLRATVWRLGDAVWVFIAGEHYSLLQTQLRARFPGVPILVTTITDGWQPGYLPTAATYGKGIYQESIAMVAPGSLERVVEEIAGQIARWVESAR